MSVIESAAAKIDQQGIFGMIAPSAQTHDPLPENDNPHIQISPRLLKNQKNHVIRVMDKAKSKK